METVVQPPADAELQLLTQWGDPFERSRQRRAGVASVLAHTALIALLVLLPEEMPKPPAETVVRHITPLIEPPTELTQRAPNKGKVTKEFNAAELTPHPRIQSPRIAPSPPPSEAKPAPLPPAPAPAPKQNAAAPPPPPPLPEPPKVEAPPKEPPKAVIPPLLQTPPPQIQAAENKPKSPFENPAAAPANPNAHSPFVSSPVEDALRQVTHTPDGRLRVGDAGIYGPGGLGRSMQLPPAPGSPGSAVELLTDAQGVDFRPYLIRVLNSVRQHWMAVLPESVRMGRRGVVSIQFAIDRQGGVPKLVIASASGADALDRAAVAGIQAAVPFPQLPSDFKGERIVLQFNFAYNMPKR